MKIVVGFTAFLIPLIASAQVVINEIAWMGTNVSANDEWIELYNSGSEMVNLEGWIVAAVDGQPSIALSGTIPGNGPASPQGGYFLLERTDDKTVPGVAADLIYTGALSNSGEKLELKNAAGTIMDSVDAMSGWPAGDNTTKETMQLLTAGSWITGAGTPRAANVTTTNGGEEKIAPASSNPASSSPVFEPTRFFTVDAGKDIKIFAGTEVRFSGAAYGFDSKLLDETSGNVRYLWNFGDGAFFEAKNTNHIYRYPGIYHATLYVSSGETSGSDMIEIAVGESNVHINEMSSVWIELINHGSAAVDMSSWQIRNGVGQTYTLPAHTIIGPAAFVVFSQEITGLLFGPLNPKAELRYANGTLADTLSFTGTLLPEKSVIRDEEENAVMGEQTPGKRNDKLPASPAERGEHITNDKLAASLRPREAGEAIQLNTKGIAASPRSGGAPRNDEQALVTEALTPPNLPLYKGRSGGVTDSNYFWLAVSISIGLIAGAVVLALRSVIRL